MISDILRIMRVGSGLTQVEAAAQLNITQPYISEIERGTKLPSADLVYKYSEFFKVPVSSIYFFSEEGINGGVTYRKFHKALSSKITALLLFLEKYADTEAETMTKRKIHSSFRSTLNVGKSSHDRHRGINKD